MFSSALKSFLKKKMGTLLNRREREREDYLSQYRTITVLDTI